MATRPLQDLPKCMAMRALMARKIAAAFPAGIQCDRNYLPWVIDGESGQWLSFDGNYSATSPHEKVSKENERQEVWESRVQADATEYAKKLVWENEIRQRVLTRDAYTCQICFSVGNSRFHVHHILKRREGGADHDDNLITVCPTCHKKADGALYNPNWVQPGGPR